MAVREIRGWSQATLLPHPPSYGRGVVNLRGAVLPIIDLSERIGLDRSAPSPQHVIIVVQVGPQLVGLLVSAFCDILAATAEMIQSTPMSRPPRLKPLSPSRTASSASCASRTSSPSSPPKPCSGR